MAFLVEISHSLREHVNNIMLLGLLHSPVTLPASLLLSKIVSNIKLLKATGINMQVDNSKLVSFQKSKK